MSDSFRDRYGPCALVAGASEGIGAAFAERLAAFGLDLVLVARREAPLEALASRLRERHGVKVTTLARDLGRVDDLRALVADVADRDIGLLVCNAALVPIGTFVERSAEEHMTLIDVNCRSAVFLSRAFGERMIARGRGGIVFMSSLGGYQGTAMMAHYAASKSYLRVLAEGLWEEMRPHGVDVLACVAGITDTPGYRSSSPDEMRVGPWRVPPVQSVDEVVEGTLRALGSGPVFVPGVFNGVVSFAMRRLMPTRTAVRTISDSTRKMYRGR